MGQSKSAHFIRTVVAREQESELRVSNEVLGYDFKPVDDGAEDLSRVRLRIRGGKVRACIEEVRRAALLGVGAHIFAC